MPTENRLFLFLGSVGAFLAVAMGAFGAHALRGHLTAPMWAVYHTGVEYQFYHALGLIGVALALAHRPASRLLKAAGWLLVAGMVLFSGSLYVLTLSGAGWVGVITPFGGTAFLAAWVLVAIFALRVK